MWKTKAEIAAAKAVPFQTVLAAMNVPFSKVSNGQLLYYSPFNNESTPSCYVDTQKNIIKDFSNDWGGDVIEFVIKKKNLRFQDAIDYLNKLDGSVILEPKKEVHFKDSKLSLIDVKPLTSQALLHYVYNRGISKELADTYLKQIHYRAKGCNYVSLGFQYDNGGYELRSPPKTLNDKGFQGGIGEKDITTIRGGGAGKVTVFEGFFDFLSYLQLRLDLYDTNYIILNSIVNIPKIPFQNYTTFRLYLDNDVPGIRATKRIINENPLKVVLDCSKNYTGFKDLNEYLQSQI